jgi:hypothetical protein
MDESEFHELKNDNIDQIKKHGVIDVRPIYTSKIIYLPYQVTERPTTLVFLCILSICKLKAVKM